MVSNTVLNTVYNGHMSKTYRVKQRLESIPTEKLEAMVENHISNPILRVGKRIRNFVKYSPNYVPTAMEYRTAKEILGLSE